VNSLLLWLIPFLWALVAHFMLKPPAKGTAELKGKKDDPGFKENGFYREYLPD
jgi:hypothetical protein